MWDCYGFGIVFLPNKIQAVHIKFPIVDVNDVRCKYVYISFDVCMFLCMCVCILLLLLCISLKGILDRYELFL